MRLRFPSPLHRLARKVGRRGAFLLFLTLLDVTLAYSLRRPLPFGLSSAAFYKPFIDVMPLEVWSWWWLGTGVLVAVAAFVPRIRPVVFGFAAFIKMVWGAGYFAGWLHHYPAYSRGYQTAVIFGGFAMIVLLVSGWRENGR
jgi:hypothetical protein